MAEPAIIVLFGITGDLAQRKLLPALYHLFKNGGLDDNTIVLGISRRAVGPKEVLQNVTFDGDDTDQAAAGKLRASLRMFTMSQTDPDEYRQLKQLLDDLEAGQGSCMHRLFYLSIPPQMFTTVVRYLGEHGLNSGCQHGNGQSRLLVEKPFGYDLASARELLAATSQWFNEDQLFRIDHYIAKDAVQNIVTARQAIPALEAMWNDERISEIAVTVAEQLDIEGRANFYEGVGALRDFVQSHLLQVLGLAVMNVPAHTMSDETHAARLEALQAIQPATVQQAARGQYDGYQAEVANPNSTTETYAELHLTSDDPRWENTTFTLITGKAMSEKRAEVRLTLKEGAIVFHIQPELGIELAGDFEQLHGAVADFNQQHQASLMNPLGYEKIFADAISGDHRLFTSVAEVLRSWEIVEDVLRAWAGNGDGLATYAKGSEKISA